MSKPFGRSITIVALLCVGSAWLITPRLRASAQNGPQWGLDAIDQRGGTDGTYHYGASGAGVNLYIVGTGVRTTHQDFGGRAAYIGDFCTGQRRTASAEYDSADGYYGHDTHVASYAAGALSGVAKSATIYSLRATWYANETDPTNGGSACVNGGQNGAVAAAIQWVASNAQRPAVLNYSGGFGDSATYGAILNAVAAGVTVTLSGDTGGSVTQHWGPDVPSVALVVGGTDSSFNALNTAADYGPSLAVFAPGQGLVGAGRRSDSDYSIPDQDIQCGCGGDSFAAPFAAGLAALYLEAHPLAPPAQVRQFITSAATPGIVSNAGTAPNHFLYSNPCGPRGDRSDLNVDCMSDLLWQQRGGTATGGLVVWFMNGFNAIGVPMSPSTVSDLTWKIVGTGDFNNDGKADVLWYNVVSGQAIVWFLSGQTMGSASYLTPNGTTDPQEWAAVAVDDFNRDGSPDILWQKQSDKSLLVWYMSGTTLLGTASILPTTSDPTWSVVATNDVNGDHRPDLIWQQNNTAQTIVWLMDNVTPIGTLVPPQTTDSSWKVVGAGDLNNDGQVDLVWQHSTAETVVVWFMNWNAVPPTFSPGGIPVRVVPMRQVGKWWGCTEFDDKQSNVAALSFAAMATWFAATRHQQVQRTSRPRGLTVREASRTA